MGFLTPTEGDGFFGGFAKGIILGYLIGLPVAAAVLWLM
jgi:hypothetical protein